MKIIYLTNEYDLYNFNGSFKLYSRDDLDLQPGDLIEVPKLQLFGKIKACDKISKTNGIWFVYDGYTPDSDEYRYWLNMRWNRGLI